MPPVLYLLALCNLVIGTGVFVLTGILVPISQSLQVSVAAAGQAMTVYALSTAVLAPLTLVLTRGWARRNALTFGMATFGAGNLLCALADGLPLLLAGRVLMGVGAVFVPVAAGIAVVLVGQARRGRALSLVFLGMSLSYVVGVPIGAWLGFRFGWQWPIGMVAALSLLSCVALRVLCPADIEAPSASFRGVWPLLRQREAFWTLGMTLLYFVAIFIVSSYIGPVMQALLPMSNERLSFTLMLFGLSGVIGTVLGGWCQDRFGALRSLRALICLLGLMMLLLPLTQGHYAPMVVVFVFWGIAGFGMMAPQQTRLAALSPVEAPLLLSLNSSMLYMGTALGAAIGGAASASLGFAPLSWVSLPFALAALGTLWISTGKTQHLKTA